MDSRETGKETQTNKVMDNTSFSRPFFYLAFDFLSIFIEVMLFEQLVNHWDPLWIRTYCWVFLFFCTGIFLKRWDPDYLKGIGEFGEKFKMISAFTVYMFGLVLGGGALFSFADIFFDGIPPIWIAIPSSFLFIFGYPVLFGIISRTRVPFRRDIPGILTHTLQFVSYSAIFLMNTYMLSFVYYQLDKFRSHTIIPVWTYPFVIIITAFLILFFYLPARIHLFFQFPRDKGNYISFIVTCAGLAIFAVTGLYFRFPF